MADWREQARRVARRHGIPEDLFLRLIKQESGFNPRARSPAGAIGLAQLMPGTARGLGVNPNDPMQNLQGGARYLAQQKKKFGRWDLALSAYNSGPGGSESAGRVEGFPETQRYVRSIMSGFNANAPARPPRAPRAPRQRGQAAPDDRSAILSQLLQSNAELAGVEAPNLSLLLETMRKRTKTREAEDVPAAEVAPARPPAAPRGDWQRWVKVPAPRGSSSKPHQAPILSFVGSIAQGYGKPLSVWDNTTHSRTTVNGNESAHYSGNAADIPAAGAKLRRLGYIALVRAGMDPAQARKAARKGGLFNVGRYQVIFATNIGGNHHDHLHVGLRG